MTARIAKPGWRLEMMRVRRKIRVLERQLNEPDADIRRLLNRIAEHEAEIAALRRLGVDDALAASADLNDLGVYGGTLRR